MDHLGLQTKTTNLNSNGGTIMLVENVNHVGLNP